MNGGAGLVQGVAEALSIYLIPIDLIKILMSYQYQLCIYMDMIYDIEIIS